MKKIKNKKGKEIAIFLLTDMFEFKIKIPFIFAMIILIMPFIAYVDFLIFEKRSIVGYFGISVLELILVWVGFTIAHAQKIMEQKTK